MADLKLFCLVDGEPTSSAFSVKIAATETIDDLKKRIKAEKPDTFDIEADLLTLWSVTVPITDKDELPVKLDTLNEKKKLFPRTLLSQVFPQEPGDDDYIIVQRPPP
ncbi:hypothetical protein BGZ54_005465, partial [Gamsiella multidivaricata]